jgi:cytidyltransferase-like protein
MRIGIVAGKFDPILDGHVQHIIKASKLCDFMIVVTHKDEIVARVSEKGFCAVPLKTRCILLRGILLDQAIDGDVVIGDDEDGTMVKTLTWLRTFHVNDELSYIKGGDRTPLTMNKDEIKICKSLGIEIQYGVGDLLSSSSKTMARINESKHSNPSKE